MAKPYTVRDAWAVLTHHLPPTDHKGLRIKARCPGLARSLTLPWDYTLNASENHALAAMTLYLAAGLKPRGLLRGLSPKGFVFMPS